MKDRISALMDGELDDKSAGLAIDLVASDGEARDTWRAYHLISDALGKSRVLSEGFSGRVAAALAKEPTVLAPKRRAAAEPRRWVALAAGVAAVSLVGWLGFAPQQSALPPVAQAPQGPKGPPEARQQRVPQLVPLPSGTNDYLLAHQAFSPRMSLQGMAPYVRTVSGPAPEARR
jgi:sigma-E factor negative regulatory protein RseA